MSTGGIARTAAIVAVFGVLSRLLGFVREAILSRAFGTTGAGGAQADAFVNALFLVNTLAALLLYALVTIVIPAFEHDRRERGEPSAWRLLWTIAAWVGLSLIVLGTFAALFPHLGARLFGLDGVRGALMTDLVRIMAPALVLQGISALLTAVLQSQRRFVGPAAVGVAFNLGIIVGLAVGGRSVEAAAWGVVIGAATQVALQLPELVTVIRRGSGRPALRHPRMRSLAVLSVPVLGASLLQQINGYTDKLFANSLEAGRTAALNYANVAGSAPRTVLLVPLLAPFFPVISRMVAEKRDLDARVVFHRAAGVLALVSIPMGAFLIVYAHEVAQILFGGSRCDLACVDDIAGPLRFYALAVWGAFIGYLLNRSLSAANRAGDVIVATLITVVVTIALDLVLLGPMEQSGLALATAIGIYVNTAVTAWMLTRRMPGLSLAHLAARQARVLACGVAGGVTALALTIPVPPDGRSTLGAAVVIGLEGLVAGAVFVAAARVIAPEELREGTQAVRSVFRRRRPA